MKILSQRRPLWAEKRIGNSKLTIGRYGCTITCLSMLTSIFGDFVLPDEIADHKEWFTHGGLVVWGALKLPHIAFEKRLCDKYVKEIEESLKSPEKAVILEIWSKSHWVVGIRKTIWGNYAVADPWQGKIITIAPSDITGSAHFVSTVKIKDEVPAWLKVKAKMPLWLRT